MKKEDSHLTLKEAQRRVDQWIQDIGLRYFDELTNMTLLSEEVGELARIMARTYGEQTWKRGEKKSAPEEELADVFWILLCLANQMGIDMEQAFKKSMQKKTRRDRRRYRKPAKP